ncbi:hypothetical protein [Streptosporangium carneum]|uniref:Integral membrane protein n=1 Tax=Streptosporangium carneum TaxID=47481 RepID=A0A9W6HWT7_9ACTN|nr:hypothetical protein [Streptosporangium carneum]GLK06814.1 hypothetical protein GCM10017600_02190 [Streptosporangium carneum]
MRRMISVIFVVLGCVLAPIALVAFWAADVVGDAGRYVETVAPLAENPAVQDAVADRVTVAITDPLQELDSSVSDHSVHVVVDRIVSGEGFPALWRRVNQVTHRRVHAILAGRGEAAAVRGGTVGLDLSPVYETARTGMVEVGMPVAARLPGLHPTMDLLFTRDLVRVRTVHAWLVRAKGALPILAAVLLVTGTLLARDRQCALIGAGLGLAGGMVVLAVVLVVIRGLFLPDFPGDGSQAEAVAAIFDALTGFLRIGLRVLFAVGLVLAVTVFAVRQTRLSRAGPPEADV